MIPNAGKDAQKLDPNALLVRMSNGIVTLKNNQAALKNT